MQTIINWTKSPVVLTDDDEKRITLRPGKSLSFNGDLTEHPWVKNGYLEIGGTGMKDTGGVGGQHDDEDDIDAVRLRYQNIFGEKPHANTSKATLLKKIDEWQHQAD
ncbi:hypothetical protein FH968_01975 [Buttiauxella sp. B2]|uniref:hypothetical protein n=1 Tax=Buttiauxella sp. B2 TaxID=2587812 RepID=UPI00111F1DD1|nr:hypothetical protein [Buttiauxella sp. B2]TNV22835.1 hypothetical protein FH968_01975 [Buttiauxella sp. B2]